MECGREREQQGITREHLQIRPANGQDKDLRLLPSVRGSEPTQRPNRRVPALDHPRLFQRRLQKAKMRIAAVRVESLDPGGISENSLI